MKIEEDFKMKIEDDFKIKIEDDFKIKTEFDDDFTYGLSSDLIDEYAGKITSTSDTSSYSSPFEMDFDVNVFPELSTNGYTSLFADFQSEDNISPNMLREDCMWTCSDNDRNRSLNKYFTAEGVMMGLGHQQVLQPNKTSQRSLLKPRPSPQLMVNPNSILPFGDVYLNDVVKNQAEKLQTPPMSDDEETKPHMTFDDMLNFIDEDLISYIKGEDNNKIEGLLHKFESDDENDNLIDVNLMGDMDIEEDQEEDHPEDDDSAGSVIDEEANSTSNEDTNDCSSINAEEEHQRRMRAFRAATSDHSYHKCITNLGVDTPSDSDEEIDVVSISKTFLPTSPSLRDRHRIQQTMENRLTKNSKPRKNITSPSTSRGSSSRQSKTQKPQRRKNGYRHCSSLDEYSEKRDLHNELEKRRRVNLAQLFHNLKILIPELDKNRTSKASKVMVLKSAKQTIDDLGQEEKTLMKSKKDLNSYHTALLKKLSNLRRDGWAERQARFYYK